MLGNLCCDGRILVTTIQKSSSYWWIDKKNYFPAQSGPHLQHQIILHFLPTHLLLHVQSVKWMRIAMVHYHKKDHVKHHSLNEE